MRILRAGDTGTALAPGRGQVQVVYEYRTVRLEESDVTVRDVLVGVDPGTGEILTFPQQSTPKLKAARDSRKDETLPVRLPAQLFDVLGLLADFYGVQQRKLAPALIRMYLAEATGRRQLASRLVRLSKTRLAEGTPKRSLKVRSTQQLLDKVNALADAVDGTSRSDFVRGAIIAAKQDVFDDYAPRRAERLEAVARAI